MLNSTIYEEKYVLPGGGGNNAFVKPQTKTDVMPTPLQPQAGVTLAQQSAFAQPQIDSMPQKAQKDAPMQPTARPNLFAKQAEPATFSKLNIPSQGAKTYTPSASNPTQSVYDYMLQPSEEEKKLYKDNESKKRLLLLGDALRHLGNLYFTTKGATPQQFTSPVVQQEQIYQQKKQELRAQRAAALKYAMDQAKLQAEQNYKNSMLGMRQAELERGLANDEWNRQWNQFKWAGDQANKDREFGFKKANADRTFAETARHNRIGEGLRAQSNKIAAMNAQTSRDSLNYKMSKDADLKNYDQVKHFINGKKLYVPKSLLNTSYGYAEIKKFYDYLSTLRVGGTADKPKYAITPLEPYQDPNGNTQPYSSKQMMKAIQEAAPTKMYMDWMLEHGAIDPDNVKYTSTRELRQRKQAEANKPQNKYAKYERK